MGWEHLNETPYIEKKRWLQRKYVKVRMIAIFIVVFVVAAIGIVFKLLEINPIDIVLQKNGFGLIKITKDNEYGGETYSGDKWATKTYYKNDRIGMFPKNAVESLQETMPLLAGTKYQSLDMVYHRDKRLMHASAYLRSRENVEKVAKAYRDFYQHYDYFEERISETDTEHPDGPFHDYSYACLKGSYKYRITIEYNRVEKRVDVHMNTDFLKDEEKEEYIEQYTEDNTNS